MMPILLPIVLALSPSAPAEIPINVTPSARGFVDFSHLAEIRATLRRKVSPEDLPRVRVTIERVTHAIRINAVAELPQRRCGTYVFHRSILLRASDWETYARAPSRQRTVRRWHVERRVRVLRSYDLSGVTVELPLDDSITYDQTRQVLLAIREGRVASAPGVSVNKPPVLDRVIRVSRESKGELVVSTSHPTNPWTGDAFVCEMRSGRLVITVLMGWCI